MIQFLRFDDARVSESEYAIISGRDAALFFMKRALYVVLFIYSTLYLAVAIPFVRTPFEPIYFIGSMATMFLLLRTFNHVLKYRTYSGGSISVSQKKVVVTQKNSRVNISPDEIKYLEHNFLGNLVIKMPGQNISFPLMLLREDDRNVLLEQFHDMAPKRTSLYKKIWEFVDAIAVALVLAVHIIQYVVQAYFIPTGSMMDTLLVGDHLFVEKITYGPIIPRMMGMDGPIHLDCMGIRGVERGDIVIFRPPHEKDKDYIKRCIAIPGDKLEIKDGDVFINGKKIDEPYVKGRTYDDPGRSKVQGIIPEGKIVVMGDNRENSMDSRYFGYLDIERIKGRAFILYWNTEQILNGNFSRIGLIR